MEEHGEILELSHNTLCNAFSRRTAIFSFSSPPLPGSVVGNLSGLNFSTSCPSQHVHQMLGWATMVLPVIILSGLKALFVHTSSGSAACCSVMISLWVHISVLTISSDQEPISLVWHHWLEGETFCPQNLLSWAPEEGGHQLPARVEQHALWWPHLEASFPKFLSCPLVLHLGNIEVLW